MLKKNDFVINEIKVLKVLQLIFFLIGPLLISLLMFWPSLGINLLWNILIPIAPLVVFLLPGLWRNICPMASTSLIPARFKFSKNIKMSKKQNAIFQNVGVLLLFLIAPLRHLGFDTSGVMSASLLLIAAIIAVVFGFFYSFKSAWCSGLCPVHPVEKLYGNRPLRTFPNLQCSSCVGCTFRCPDSIKGQANDKYQKDSQFAAKVMYGAFPGFVWGWFQVRDYSFIEGLANIGLIFYYPFFGGIVSMILYLVVKKLFTKVHLEKINLLFSFLSIGSYYWYRIAQLFGYGKFPGDGMLINVTEFISESELVLIRILFVGLILFLNLKLRNKNWSSRPRFIRPDLLFCGPQLEKS